MEITAAQALIVNLSDQTWAANEKSRNAQEVIDAQAAYDTLEASVKPAEIALEIANQWL